MPGDERAARILSTLLAHPGWSDQRAAAHLGCEAGAVARARRHYGLEAQTKRAEGALRRRAPGGLLAKLEAALGVAVERVGPLPPAGRYYVLPRAEREPPPRAPR